MKRAAFYRKDESGRWHHVQDGVVIAEGTSFALVQFFPDSVNYAGREWLPLSARNSRLTISEPGK